MKTNKKDIIDFAEWYSGMSREKVENAYERYLREVKTKTKSCKLCSNPAMEDYDLCYDHAVSNIPKKE